MNELEKLVGMLENSGIPHTLENETIVVPSKDDPVAIIKEVGPPVLYTMVFEGEDRMGLIGLTDAETAFNRIENAMNKED